MFYFLILEPIGSVPPKITNLHDKFQFVQVKLNEDYSMQCPGQAYPVPIVRLVLFIISLVNMIYSFVEPIGSVPPKITSLHDKFQVLQVKLSEDYAMQCPGQAYPVPLVRLVLKIPRPHSVLQLRFRYLSISTYVTFLVEPVGSVAPKVDTRDEFTFARTQLGLSKAIICPAQSYPMPSFR